MKNKIDITLCSATLSQDGKVEPPIGPLYIASALEEVGVNVDFRDFQLYKNANGFVGDALAAFMEGHFDIVAISCFVDMLPSVIDATRILHNKRPKTIFVLGGPGSTEKATEILGLYPWITCIVRSEGEKTIQEWVKRIGINSEDEIEGLTYRKGLKIIEGSKRKRIANIDDLPLPAYHLINFNDYDNARIITTRGCSYNCSFCDVTALWGNKSISRDLNKVIDEIAMLHNTYGISYIGIVDDTFVLDRNRVQEFCGQLLDRRLDIKWGCFGRINLMNRALIEQMAQSGCRAIFYGIDSGSQKILDETGKKIKLENIYEVIKLSSKYFDQVEASFIWGYPSETFEDFNQTLYLAASLSEFAPKVNVQMHMLSALPSSKIYREFEGELLEPEIEDKEWMLLSDLFINEKSKKIRELIKAAPHIYPGFYTFPTHDKAKKRTLMFRVMKKLHQLIGLTLIDSQVEELLKTPNNILERQLMMDARDPVDKIGVGLSLGYFKRLRKIKSEHLSKKKLKNLPGSREQVY